MRPELWASWAEQARRPSGLGGGAGLGWPAGQGRKMAGPVEEGRGHEETELEGMAELNGPKGRKYLGQISSGLCPIRFRKISK
jgi:hypothetical protein